MTKHNKGTVVAFGVPDDAVFWPHSCTCSVSQPTIQLISEVYETFQFAKFFRKNVTLMSSVIPDPGSKHEAAFSLPCSLCSRQEWIFLKLWS